MLMSANIARNPQFACLLIIFATEIEMRDILQPPFDHHAFSARTGCIWIVAHALLLGGLLLLALTTTTIVPYGTT